MGPVTVIEGGDEAYIDVTCNLPPHYFCTDRQTSDGPETCQLGVWAYIDPVDDDLLCYDSGDVVSQAVFGYMTGYAETVHRTCGVYLNTDNWLAGVQIPVSAMSDGVADGDLTRTAHLHHEVLYDQTSVYNAEIGTLEARTP